MPGSHSMNSGCCPRLRSLERTLEAAATDDRLHVARDAMTVGGGCQCLAHHAASLSSPRYRYPILATATITAALVPTAFCSLRRRRVTWVSTVRLLRFRSTR